MARLLFFTGPQSENTPEIQSHREFECLKEILDKQQAIQLLLPTLTGRKSDLVRLLTEPDGPDIFHFAGHGQGKDLRLLNDSNQQTLLGVEDATKLFKHCAQMGVVLNACSSASVAESISGSVRFAVGYRGKLLDEVAISFTKSFYRCLSGGKMLADAFEIAVLQSGGSTLHPDTKPVLFCHGELDPKNYSIGSKTTSNSEQKIRQIGDGVTMASNFAAANENKGLITEQMTINGSVTINNFNQDPNPQRQNKDIFRNLSEKKVDDAEETDDGSEPSERNLMLQAIAEEFQNCPSLANCLCSLTALQENFIPNAKPATWLYTQIRERYDRETCESLTTQERDSLNNLMDIGTFIEMPWESHQLVETEFKRAMEKRIEQLGGNDSHAVDYGTEDKEFVVFSYANALSSLRLEAKRDGEREFPHRLIHAIRNVDFRARFNLRGKNVFRPVELPVSVYQMDPPSTKGRNLLKSVAAICSTILHLDSWHPNDNSRRIEEDPNEIINRFKINTDTRPNRYIAVCLNEEYCQGLIKEIRKNVPQLIVVPVSKSQQQVFQHLSEIRNHFFNILEENTIQ